MGTAKPDLTEPRRAGKDTYLFLGNQELTTMPRIAPARRAKAHITTDWKDHAVRPRRTANGDTFILDP